LYTDYIILTLSLLSAILGIVVMYFSREAFWYGRIQGFKVNESISNIVVKIHQKFINLQVL